MVKSEKGELKGEPFIDVGPLALCCFWPPPHEMPAKHIYRVPAHIYATILDYTSRGLQGGSAAKRPRLRGSTRNHQIARSYCAWLLSCSIYTHHFIAAHLITFDILASRAYTRWLFVSFRPSLLSCQSILLKFFSLFFFSYHAALSPSLSAVHYVVLTGPPHQLKVPFCRMEFYKRSFLASAFNLWNS